MEGNFFSCFFVEQSENVFFVGATCLVYKVLFYVFSHVFFSQHSYRKNTKIVVFSPPGLPTFFLQEKKKRKNGRKKKKEKKRF